MPPPLTVPTGRKRALAWALLLLPLLAFLLHAAAFHYVVDDAFISYRYARNLAEGRGLVFNPGERVEGYTNFLWVMLTAAGFAARADPVVWTRGLGLACGALTLLALYRRARARAAPLPLLPPLFLAASGAFALWSQAGLESPLFALLVLLGVHEAAELPARRGPGRRDAVWGAWLGLATLTRPDGALFFSTALAAIAMQLPRGGRARALSGAAAWGGLILPWLLWRRAYYDAWLPNTWHAKTGGGVAAVERGLAYLGGGALACGVVLLLLPFALLRRGGERRHAAAAISAAAWFAYVLLVGGDGLAMYRFFVPVLPLVALLAGDAIAALWRERRPAAAALAGLALAASLPASFTGDARRFVEEDRARVERHWSHIGRFLASYARPGESIAVTTAGAIPFYSGLPAIDMLGITDPHIARRKMPGMGRGIAGHEKHDAAYVLDRRPSYILHYEFLINRPVVDRSQFLTPWNPGLAELADAPRFGQLYEPRVVELGAGVYFAFFALRREAGGSEPPAAP